VGVGLWLWLGCGRGCVFRRAGDGRIDEAVENVLDEAEAEKEDIRRCTDGRHRDRQRGERHGWIKLPGRSAEEKGMERGVTYIGHAENLAIALSSANKPIVGY
jgi:hypothetical protein